MNRRSRVSQLQLGLVFLLCWIGRAAASELPILGVDARLVVSASERTCLIAIISRSGWEVLSKVQVTVFDSNSQRFRVGPVDLAPGQTKVLSRTVDDNTRCSGEGVFYQVSFERFGTPNDAIISGPISSASVGAPPLVAASVGAIIAFVSAIAGALLTHRLTLTREGLKEKRDRYNRVEPVFNEFFTTWNRSPMPEELQLRFEELRRKVRLPPRIVDQYHHTYSRLADPHNLTDRKRQDVTEFEQYLWDYLNELDPEHTL